MAKGIINLDKAICAAWDAASLDDTITGGLHQDIAPDADVVPPYAVYRTQSAPVDTRTSNGGGSGSVYINDQFDISVFYFGSPVAQVEALVDPIRDAFDNADLNLDFGECLRCQFVNEAKINLDGRDGMRQHMLNYIVTRRETETK